ncbi:NAD(P)-binding protein [Peniophora sp. CONT]|nr:NAD(P)-binding protein [Peniophora sp. CONT]
MDTIKTTLAENITGAHGLAPKGSQFSLEEFSLEEVPDQTGKVALVTGGSEGIGYGCTHTLLSKNISKLFIISQSSDVIDKALDAIREELGPAAADKVVWLQCDLSDWKKTAEAAFEVTSKTDRLDVLILNAARGIMTAQKDAHGVDLHMAINHIGHVALTSHLLPLLKKTASSGNKVRIVTLGSNAHQLTPKETRFDSLEELNKDFGPNPQYGRSKLAQMLYARYLADHLRSSDPNVLVNTIHPGIVDTKQTNEHIHEAYPLGGYGMSVLMKPFKKSIFEAATPAMYAATKTEESGQYICGPAIVEPGSEMSQDKALGERLMKLTEDIIQERTSASDKGCPVKST